MIKLKNIFSALFVSSVLIGCGGGNSTPSLSASAQSQLDTLVSNFMTTNSINAGAITVMNGGNVLYSKSYGFQDVGKTTMTVTNPLMVSASIVKPLTAAAVQKLATAGTLRLTDHVFCTGSNTDANTDCWITVKDTSNTTVSGFGSSAQNFKDSRYANITIQQLIDHEGGWDRYAINCYGASNFSTLDTPCDPMVQEFLIQQTLGLGASQLPTQMNDIYFWVNKNSLDFNPGARQVYSNFGYMLLAAIVTQASGTDFSTYAYNNILLPLGVAAADFGIFSYSPAVNSAQALRTPSIQTSLTCKSIYQSNNGSTILATTQGCLNPINWIGAATSLVTPKAMATFAGAYRIDNTSNLDANNHPSLDGPNNGKPLSGQTNSGVHYGDLPGVNNIIRQLATGTSYTLMLSKDSTPAGNWQQTLYPQIDTIISGSNY